MDEVHRHEILTCGELDLFVEGAYRLLRTLRKVDHDYQLVRRGYELVYGLDFSEIFTFLWPERSPQQNRSVVSKLLRCDNLHFTLPPGSVLELINSLSRFSTQSLATRSRYLSLVSQPFFASALRQVELAKSPIAKDGPIYTRFLDEFADAVHYGGFMARLADLHGLRNLVDLSEYTRDGAPVEPDPDKFAEALSALNIYRRPSLEQNTLIDAHNYALLYAFSERQYISTAKRIFFLTTSSPIPYSVLRRIKWSRFPDVLKDPDISETSLVRHPIHAYYLSLLLSQGPQSGKELRFLINNLASILRRFASLPEYEQFIHDGRARPETPIKLPQRKEHLRSQLQFSRRYHELFFKAREAIESDLVIETNLRDRLHIGDWSLGSAIRSDWRPIDILGHTDSRQDSQSTSALLFFDRDVTVRLFDNVHRMALLAVKRMRRSLEKLSPEFLRDVDLEGVVIKRDRPTIRWRYDPEGACSEFTAERAIGERIERLSEGRVYDDYCSVYWRTRVNFAEFLDACNSYAKNTKWSNPGRKKAYQGVVLIGEDAQERHLRFSEGDLLRLRPGDLLEAASGLQLSLVRIGYPFGDLWYDFVPLRDREQLIGILTHVPEVRSMARLFQGTCRSKTSMREAIDIGTSVVRRFRDVRQRRPKEQEDRRSTHETERQV